MKQASLKSLLQIDVYGPVRKLANCQSVPREIPPCAQDLRSDTKTDGMMMLSVSQAKREGRTILVVDDEPAILDLIQRVLKHTGYNVIISRSGDLAWDVIDQGQPNVDLVLTDIVMPGSMDGFTLTDNARRKYRYLPVLFMTERCQQVTRKRRR